MGYYIETDGPKNKAAWLVANHGAVIVSCNEAKDALYRGEGVVCVVNNGPFEAAGYIYSDWEMNAFTDPHDHRPKTWVVMDKATAERLSGFNH